MWICCIGFASLLLILLSKRLKWECRLVELPLLTDVHIFLIMTIFHRGLAALGLGIASGYGFRRYQEIRNFGEDIGEMQLHDENYEWKWVWKLPAGLGHVQGYGRNETNRVQKESKTISEEESIDVTYISK